MVITYRILYLKDIWQIAEVLLKLINYRPTNTNFNKNRVKFNEFVWFPNRE